MTGTLKNKPAACCCECTIEHIDGETEVSGDTIRAAEHPQLPYPPWVEAEISVAVGDTLKLFWAWDDSSPGDGFYCEYTPQDGATLGTLKLFRKDATQLGVTLDLLCANEDYWHKLTACWNPDTCDVVVCFSARDDRGWIVRNQCIKEDAPSGFVGGRKAGYGGTGTIKRYKFDRLWYCGDPPYTSDCGSDCVDGYEYVGDLPTRIKCHSCGAGCIVVAEDFGDPTTTGDMPCGWDAAGTGWTVVDGEATGDGPVCHLFDTTTGSYIIEATFFLGSLGTIGDSVTVSLSHGATTHSLTVTRVAGVNPGDPDRYKYEWVPAGFVTYYQATQLSSITLSICPYKICNNAVQTIVEEVVVPGAVCVSITQPTAADATLQHFTITKSKEMDDDCPECKCVTECADYCVDSVWPSAWMVELQDVESYCCDIDGINRAFYANKYYGSCHSYGFGDDGHGVLLSDVSCTDPQWVNFSNDPETCCKAYYTFGIGGYIVTKCYVIASGGDAALRACVPSRHKEGSVYYPVRIDVYLLAGVGEAHTIVVEIYRLVFDWYYRFLSGVVTGHRWFASQVLTYTKQYSSITDCQNLTDEEIPLVSASQFGIFDKDTIVDPGTTYKCDADPDYSDEVLSVWGRIDSLTGTITSSSTVKLTAL